MNGYSFCAAVIQAILGWPVAFVIAVWLFREKLNPVEKQQRVLPWWRLLANGSYAFFVRPGVKPIEFEKGKTAIAVASLDKLPSVIDTLIHAVRAGELDAQLEQSSKRAPSKKKSAKA